MTSMSSGQEAQELKGIIARLASRYPAITYRVVAWGLFAMVTGGGTWLTSVWAQGKTTALAVEVMKSRQDRADEDRRDINAAMTEIRNDVKELLKRSGPRVRLDEEPVSPPWQGRADHLRTPRPERPAPPVLQGGR